MFGWITGKKDHHSVTLSSEAQARLMTMVNVLGQAIPDLASLSPDDLVEQLLQGHLALVSSTAKQAITLEDGIITLVDVPPVPVAPSDTANPAIPEVVESLVEPSAESPTPETVPPEPDYLEPETSPEKLVTPPVVDVREQHLASLKQQISYLQNRLNQTHAQQAAFHASHTQLLQTSQQQAQLIDDLQKQVTQLRQAANIGEAQLNRWRSHHFSQ